jgi:carboxyl-terminal processing protease
MHYENRKKDIVYPIALALVLIAGIFIGVKLKGNADKPNLLVYPRTDKLSSVLKYVEDEYVDGVSMGKLVEMTIPAMLKNLDPHSVYIPASEFQAVNEPLEGGLDGIGVQFNMPNDTVVVVNTIPGGPSERAGVLAGDRIVRINGRNVAGVKFPQDSVPKLLKGPTGTKVRIGVKRSEVAELIDFELTRDKIPLNSVDVSYMATSDIGYIKINTFAKTTYDEFMAAVAKLRRLGMKKMVLDLRSNSGGYMDAATNIANEFLPENRLIVYTQGKNRPRQEAISNSRGTCRDIGLVILIDEFSASASEILAGAIQDNDRGTIMGRRSFGKGLVQEQIFFSDGSALRLTIARYYTPSGRSIQKPYSPGDDEYFNDITKRYIHGEFQESDSIRFADSLKYYTVGGRVVYGGGGIMPDKFIPLDTNGITPYLRKVSSRNLIYRFSFNFADMHRKEIRELKTFESVKQYLERFRLLDDFIAFAEKSGVPRNEKQISHSRVILETQLKAAIARNIIDNEGFYPFIMHIDETLKQAIKTLQDNPDPLKVIAGGYPRVSLQGWIQAQLKTSLRKEAIALSA